MRKLVFVLMVVLVGSAPARDSLNCRELGTWPFGPCNAVALDPARSLCFAGAGDGVYVLDVSDPTHPVNLSDTIHARCGVLALCYGANRLYIACHDDGLEIWDVGSPPAPARLGSYDTPGLAHGVAVSGNYAYVADEDSGLRIIDVSDPQRPNEAGHCDTPGLAYGVVVSSNYAYVADRSSGLRIISVANPQSPFEVGYYQTLGYAHGLAVSGSYAYVADGYSGLRVVDVANPQSPYEAGYCDVPDLTCGVAVSGNYAYVAAYDSGLHIIDVTNPQSPFEAGDYDTPGHARGVAVSGNCAYVADGSSGTRIIEFYGAGMEEEANGKLRTTNGASVVRGVLHLGGHGRSTTGQSLGFLLDAAGRRAMALRYGPNDVSRLAPGVYFVRTTTQVTKVVVQP